MATTPPHLPTTHLPTPPQRNATPTQPYLKFHNPKTFEDMAKPVPNFRAAGLKAGEVPRFFDNVLQGRAAESVAAKGAWWEARKAAAAEALAPTSGKASPPLPSLPVPDWKYGQPVSTASLQTVTDAYFAALEPKRKLRLPTMPAQVTDSLSSYLRSLGQSEALPELTTSLLTALADKAVVTEGGAEVKGFKYTSRAQAARLVAGRRQQVHDRWLKLWAKKVLVAPELAVVPLKEVDGQLASRFEHVSPKYADLLHQVSMGTQTFGQRYAAKAYFDNPFTRREVAKVATDDFPPSELEVQGTELAKQLDDPTAALHKLLGPTVDMVGSGSALMSEQVAAATEHRYTPDRYMYREGMAYAARLKAEEAALREELAPAHGPHVDVAKYQVAPRSPVQQMFDRVKEAAAAAGGLAAQKAAAAGDPYTVYALSKREALLADPSNMPLDEVLYPEISQEALELELAELDELEAMIDDAEEEELWSLTLTQQFKHLHAFFQTEMPMSVLQHMDPLFIKKVDWETSHGYVDFDKTLEDLKSEYMSEMWGLENLSHHFLPLIRYRRHKARQMAGRYEPEMVPIPTKAAAASQ